jgi:hypothetical protein
VSGGLQLTRCYLSDGSRRSDDSNPVTAVGAVDERCRLNSRGDFNILSEAWIHAPELMSYRISVNPIMGHYGRPRRPIKKGTAGGLRFPPVAKRNNSSHSVVRESLRPCAIG